MLACSGNSPGLASVSLPLDGGVRSQNDASVIRIIVRSVDAAGRHWNCVAAAYSASRLFSGHVRLLGVPSSCRGGLALVILIWLASSALSASTLSYVMPPFIT